MWPDILRKGYRREMFAAFYCFVACCIGLPMTFYVSKAHVQKWNSHSHICLPKAKSTCWLLVQYGLHTRYLYVNELIYIWTWPDLPDLQPSSRGISLRWLPNKYLYPLLYVLRQMSCGSYWCYVVSKAKNPDVLKPFFVWSSSGSGVMDVPLQQYFWIATVSHSWNVTKVFDVFWFGLWILSPYGS